ncbi:MAG: MBL fold metallo-hydrolase [Kineosporiaceae bacterium]|nr:MBL fold metallo-hydrolase [Kineosporiaceae bacterium]MBK7625069.1 MBL fold metallo-hydrolase [Kineosporiaceae bacterium]
MLLVGFPAAAFATNCYLLAPSAGQECLIIDPGIGVLDTLAEVLAEYRLRPAAVLLTHGHADHVYSVTPVCGGHGVPALIHGDDRYRLKDPLRTLDPELVMMLEQQFGDKAAWTEPDDVRLVGDGEQVELAGLTTTVIHAPGHTEGSVMFALDAVPEGVPADSGITSTLISGDVLFAGSIGRTDLPGGNHAAMMRSLRTKVLAQPDGALVLPGHGPATTIARERASNPYLREARG